MKLLAWDTSSKAGALVALEWDPQSKLGWEGVRLASEWALNVDATHSEGLLWGIQQVLESARWQLEEVDLFGVGVGPGSFTGLRIGLTTARTLAHTLQRPLIGVSSLAALARPVALSLSQAREKVILVASSDACKGELYALWGNSRAVAECAAMAQMDSPGLWKRGVEEQVLTPDVLVKNLEKKLAQERGSKWIAIGEGRNRYPDAWRKLPKSRRLDAPLLWTDQVQGRYLGLLVWESYQAGLAKPALQVHPRYLRASDAELKLKAGLLPPGPTRGVSR